MKIQREIWQFAFSRLTVKCKQVVQRKGRVGRVDTSLILSLLLFAPMPLFVGPKHISAHRNAFNAGYPERGSVPMTEKMTAGMQQG